MFDVDKITLIIAFTSMLAFAFPFYWYHRKNKIKNHEKAQKLKAFISHHRLSIIREETWRSRYYIGLDSAQKKLVYVEDLEQFRPQLIDLHQVKQVVFHEISRTVGEKANSKKVVDELKLQLLNQKGKMVASLEFYDGEKFSDLLGEPIVIKNWEALIQEQLKNMQQVQKV